MGAKLGHGLPRRKPFQSYAKGNPMKRPTNCMDSLWVQWHQSNASVSPYSKTRAGMNTSRSLAPRPVRPSDSYDTTIRSAQPSSRILLARPLYEPYLSTPALHGIRTQNRTWTRSKLSRYEQLALWQIDTTTHLVYNKTWTTSWNGHPSSTTGQFQGYQCYKILHEQLYIDSSKLTPSPTETKMRTLTATFLYSVLNHVLRSSFFPNTINDWNELPAEAVAVCTLDTVGSRVRWVDFSPPWCQSLMIVAKWWTRWLWPLHGRRRRMIRLKAFTFAWYFKSEKYISYIMLYISIIITYFTRKKLPFGS